MTSEKVPEQNQIAFPIEERSKAEFWAWLCEGYPISTNQKKKANRKIIILSKNTVKTAISEALKNNDTAKAQELLDIASRPEEQPTEQMVRKSVRVTPGEYVKLLYLKMKEQTSFADVMMKILNKPCKRMVETLNKQFNERKLPTTRLNYLTKVIDEWEKEKPESRARIAEWGNWVKSSYRFSSKNNKPVVANEWDNYQLPIPLDHKTYVSITPFYSKSVHDANYKQQIIDTFSKFAMTDLIIKATGGDLSKPASKLFYEFNQEWLQKIEEKPFFDQITFRAFIDNTTKKQELFFGIYFEIYAGYSAKRELELFSKYTEEDVNEFIDRVKLLEYPSYSVNGHFNGITNTNDYKEWVTSSPLDNTEENHFWIQIGTEIDMTCCKITPDSKDYYEIDWPEIPPALEKHRRQFELLVKEIAKKVGFNLLHKSNLTYPKLTLNADKLIPKALEKASTPGDYRKINNLLTLKNLYFDYRKITDFGEEITKSTIKHQSVISFYINSDLWRMIPLVLKENNWIEMVDEYLNNNASNDG